MCMLIIVEFFYEICKCTFYHEIYNIFSLNCVLRVKLHGPKDAVVSQKHLDIANPVQSVSTNSEESGLSLHGTFFNI